MLSPVQMVIMTSAKQNRKKVLDGVNICTFERNIDSIYKPNLIKCGKSGAKTITMIKEGQLYKPLYITINGDKQALFKNNVSLLTELIEKYK